MSVEPKWRFCAVYADKVYYQGLFNKEAKTKSYIIKVVAFLGLLHLGDKNLSTTINT